MTELDIVFVFVFVFVFEGDLIDHAKERRATLTSAASNRRARKAIS